MSESDRIERLRGTLTELDRDLETRTEKASKRSRGVADLVRLLALLMGGLALANLYFVNDLTQEIQLVIGNMDEMSDHFERVSRLMTDVRETVGDMEDNVKMVPIVSAQTREIAARMDGMRGNVARVGTSSASLDRRMDIMNAGVADMSVRFRSLNQSIGTMSGDVDQMARPVP
jgi:methyl-accepting chemotaxis protein